MKSLARAFPLNPLFVKLFVATAIACCLFVFLTPRAQAASLTEPQIQAIVNLLVAFDVDEETIATVDAILHAPAGEALGASTQAATSTNSSLTTTNPPALTGSTTSFTASSKSGMAPLAVNFTLINGMDGVMYSIDFGDGSGTAQVRNGGGVLSNVSHSYTSAGTYTATLSRHIGGPSGPEQLVGTVRIKVTKSSDTATIDTSSLISTTGMVTISGTAQVAKGFVNVSVLNRDGGQIFGSGALVTEGRWSATDPTPISNGIYPVRVYADNEMIVLLAKGSLTVRVPKPVQIALRTPRAGQTLKKGQQFEIRWASKNLPPNATLDIAIFNGNEASIKYPNATIAVGLGATTTSYTWKVKANDSWGIGMKSFTEKLASVLGIPVAQAADSNYVIAVCERVPGTLGTLACGSSGVFTITSKTPKAALSITGLAASVAMVPYQLVVDLLTDLFIGLGIGQNNLLAASATAIPLNTLSLRASAQIHSSSGFVTYLYPFKLATTSEYLGLSGSITLQSANPGKFSEALVSVMTSPGACPTQGENFPTDYKELAKRYPGSTALASYILKLSSEPSATLPVDFTLTVGVPVQPCVFVVLDGGFPSNSGVVTVTSNLTLHYHPGAPSAATSLVAIDDELCFGQTWGCQLATLGTGNTVAFRKVVPITKQGDLLALVGNISDGAFTGGALAQPPQGTWSSDNDFYIYHNCTLSKGLSGPGNFFQLVPQDAQALARVHQSGTGSVVLQTPLYQTFNDTTLVPGDCLVHLVRVSGDAGKVLVGGVDAESQVRAVVSSAPVLSISATPGSLVVGSSATISWSARNAATCSVSAEDGSSQAGSGLKGKLQTGALSTTTSYTLTCTSVSGTTASAQASVVVTPAPDKTGPVVSITAPHNGQRVSGSVYISAQVDDKPGKGQSASGVSSVRFAVNGKIIGTDTQLPYSFVWNTAALATGTYTITVTARDAAGNESTLDRQVSVVHVAEGATLVRLNRYYYNYGYFGNHLDLALEAKPSGISDPYNKEGPLGYLSTEPGQELVPLHECLINYDSRHGLADTFASTNANCEGSQKIDMLGYIWTGQSSQGDRKPLYRCIRSTSQGFAFGLVNVNFMDHFTSLSAGCEGGGSREGVLGYVSTASAVAPALVLRAAPGTVGYGKQSLVTWSGAGAASCAITFGKTVFAEGLSGTKATDPLTATTTFKLSCAKTNGAASATTTTVGVIMPPLPTCTLSASSAAIQKGQSATLSWTTTDAVSGSINRGVGTTTPVVSGSTTVTPPRTTSYTATVRNVAGKGATCSVQVTVITSRVSLPDDITGLAASVAMAPFNLMIDSLTNIFVALGVGSQPAAVENATRLPFATSVCTAIRCV